MTHVSHPLPGQEMTLLLSEGVQFKRLGNPFEVISGYLCSSQHVIWYKPNDIQMAAVTVLEIKVLISCFKNPLF